MNGDKDWIEPVATVGAFITTWVLTAIGVARSHGKLESRVDNTESDMTEIKAMFKTADGEPRLLSFAAHESICSERQKLMHSEFKHMREAVDRIEQKFDAYIKKNGGTK